ncbi:hypothetical protein R3P38DRAFT_3168882 [Favolaschia claudopus]|uniref:Uncharacterized protein n=1 Tax=Favolaschia claudopus TaxID=2862362 RepID=A0AAW0DZM6_9AGAR
MSPWMLPHHFLDVTLTFPLASDCESELAQIHLAFKEGRPHVENWGDYRMLWVFREGGYACSKAIAVRRTAIAEPYIFECWLARTVANPVVPLPLPGSWGSCGGDSEDGKGWGGSDGDSESGAWGVSSEDDWTQRWGGASWGGGGWSIEGDPTWSRHRSLTSFGWITWRDLEWDGIHRVPKTRGKRKRQRQRKAVKRASEAAAAAAAASAAAEARAAADRQARIWLEQYLDKNPTPECC